MTIPENIRLASIYWKQSASDLKSSKFSLLLRKYSKSSMLSVQAAMNALTALCIANNRYQNPTYNLSELLLVSCKFYEKLDVLKEICQEMDQIQEMTPFTEAKRQGKLMDKQTAKKMPPKAKKVQEACKQIIKENNLFQI